MEKEISNNHKHALILIDQLIGYSKAQDIEYNKLLAEKKVYRQGDTVVTHGLNQLKELLYNL
jgi:hypothetical protein